MHQPPERAKKVGLNPPYTAIYQDMPNAISLIIGQQEWAEKGVILPFHCGLNGSGKIVVDSSFQPRDVDWTARVNRPMTEKELAAIRHCIRRGTPFGTKAWTSKAAEKQ